MSFLILLNLSGKNNIIIRLGNTLIKEFSILNNKLEIDNHLYYFFSKQDDYDNDIFINYKYLEYISYLILSDEEPNKIYCKIISFIFLKIIYYNEEGNKFAKYFSYNFLYLNILLTGETRAGKSSFIN